LPQSSVLPLELVYVDRAINKSRRDPPNAGTKLYTDMSREVVFSTMNHEV
jgi:hypothetical protein